MKRIIPLLITISFILFLSCNDGKLSLTEEIVDIGFKEPTLYISTTKTTSTPLVIKGNVGFPTEDYWIYVSAEDPNEWIENILNISNHVVESADHPNGKHNIVYKVLMKRGNLVCALMITPLAHPEENIDREISFTLLTDPNQTKQYNGLDFYKVNESKNTAKVIITKE